MNQLKIPFLLLIVLFVCGLACASGRQGGEYGPGSTGPSRGRQGGNGNGNGNGNRGGDHGGRRNGGSRGAFDEDFGIGRYGRPSNGEQGDKKYRSNLYNDDDVYGYDASYPNGEAAYINYRSKDARARRGPEFARTSRAYSRQGGGGGRNGASDFGQVNEYSGGQGRGAW